MRITAALLLMLTFGVAPAVHAAVSEVPGSEHWKALEEAERIDADGLYRLRERLGGRLILYDARSRRSYEEGHIEGARLPLTDRFYQEQELFRLKVTQTPPDMDAALVSAVEGLDRSSPIVTYCDAECGASKVLLAKLKNLGFTDVRALEGGYQSWAERGYPVSGVSAR